MLDLIVMQMSRVNREKGYWNQLRAMFLIRNDSVVLIEKSNDGQCPAQPINQAIGKITDLLLPISKGTYECCAA